MVSGVVVMLLWIVMGKVVVKGVAVVVTVTGGGSTVVGFEVVVVSGSLIAVVEVVVDTVELLGASTPLCNTHLNQHHSLNNRENQANAVVHYLSNMHVSCCIYTSYPTFCVF